MTPILVPKPARPVWRTTRITLACVDAPHEAPAQVSTAAPGLAIHADAWTRLWSVTHIPSGLRLLHALPSEHTAQGLAVELARAVNWTRPVDELRDDPEAWAAVKRFLYLQEV